MKITGSPKLNLTLYSLLMILTPFLLLQNYLQEAIGALSDISFSAGSADIPIFLFLVVIAALFSVGLLIRHFSWGRIAGLLLVALLLVIGYLTSDYYFNQHFYDIQHNWHYFAYGIYSWLAWQYFTSRHLTAEKIILFTFLYAFGISLMDEIIQVFISNRVFDLSDVAKDLWGCMIGQVFTHFVVHDLRYLSLPGKNRKDHRHGFRSPAGLLATQLLFTWVFLNVASLLTNMQYVAQVFIFTLVIFFLLRGLIHLAGKGRYRYLWLGVLIFLILYPGICLLIAKPRAGMVAKSLFSYKGIPVYYFDLMVYPNGLIRPVDKKISFNMRDQQKIADIGPDILLLGTGSTGQGGKGFNDQLGVEMRYNHAKKKVYQVIKLSNEEACAHYNRLIKQGKNVLLILHNS